MTKEGAVAVEIEAMQNHLKDGGMFFTLTQSDSLVLRFVPVRLEPTQCEVGDSEGPQEDGGVDQHNRCVAVAACYAECTPPSPQPDSAKHLADLADVPPSDRHGKSTRDKGL